METAKRMSLMFTLITAILAGAAGPAAAAGNAAAETKVIVFAAASTTDAVTGIGDLFAARGLGKIESSFASSSTLAKQIANGAPADIFLSADKEWMDFLEKKDAIDKASRFDLLGNRLVLIAPSHSTIQSVEVRKGLDLGALLGADGRLAVGDPEHVPVGMYGKQAMETLGLWEQVKDRLAPMKDVRAALALVERAETPLGLVYATDAAISKKVRVVGAFPVQSHPPIVYPAALVKGGNVREAAVFLDFLKTPEARAVFAKYGFEVR